MQGLHLCGVGPGESITFRVAEQALIVVKSGANTFLCGCTNNAAAAGFNSNSVICDRNTAFVSD